MSKKIICLALGALLLALSFPAEAQQPKKVHRIGYLHAASASDPRVQHQREAFQKGLRELGYIEGQNIVVEYRWTEGKPDRLFDLAAELVRLKMSVIVAAGGAPVVRAVQRATTTIPIVMTAIPDPVADGFVANLARPGGNITGTTAITPELSGKRLELLKEAFPRISRIAVLWESGVESGQFKATEVASRLLGLQLQALEVRSPNDFDSAFAAAQKARAGALIVLGSATLFAERTYLAVLAAKSRLPAMYVHRGFVDSGGLMSYGPNFTDLFRRTATYVDKILKGTKPADLPVEQPTRFELVINLKTAKALGLTIPQSILIRADQIIQ